MKMSFLNIPLYYPCDRWFLFSIILYIFSITLKFKSFDINKFNKTNWSFALSI